MPNIILRRESGIIFKEIGYWYEKMCQTQVVDSVSEIYT